MWATFIDLRKGFDAMDRERLMEILEDRGVGPNLRRLVRVFWEMATFCCQAGGNHGRPFKAFRGVTQGGPLSPRLFNIMVDAIVQEWMRQVMGAPSNPDSSCRLGKIFLAQKHPVSPKCRISQAKH